VTRWPLAPLLVLAEQGEAGARRALSLALEAEALRRAERDVAADALRAATWADAEAAARTHPASEAAGVLRDGAHHLARLRAEVLRRAEALRAAAAAVSSAAGEVEARRVALQAATTAVEALAAQRDAWRRWLDRRRERREEVAVEDLVSARSGAER
jgi:hypothetical protein